MKNQSIAKQVLFLSVIAYFVSQTLPVLRVMPIGLTLALAVITLGPIFFFVGVAILIRRFMAMRQVHHHV